MKNETLKLNVSNVEMNQINYDFFCESLLTSIPKIEETCKRIDASIKRMCKTMPPYSYRLFRAMGYSVPPYGAALEYYDAVIEEINYKRDLVDIYSLFMKWYGKLSDRDKNIYVKYFIHDKYCRLKVISDMVHSFEVYLQLNSDLKIKNLMKNPYLYKNYISTLEKSKRINKPNRKENDHDSTTNEKCYS